MRLMPKRSLGTRYRCSLQPAAEILRVRAGGPGTLSGVLWAQLGWFSSRARPPLLCSCPRGLSYLLLLVYRQRPIAGGGRWTPTATARSRPRVRNLPPRSRLRAPSFWWSRCSPRFRGNPRFSELGPRPLPRSVTLRVSERHALCSFWEATRPGCSRVAGVRGDGTTWHLGSAVGRAY